MVKTLQKLFNCSITFLGESELHSSNYVQFELRLIFFLCRFWRENDVFVERIVTTLCNTLIEFAKVFKSLGVNLVQIEGWKKFVLDIFVPCDSAQLSSLLPKHHRFELAIFRSFFKFSLEKSCKHFYLLAHQNQILTK